MLAKRIIPCLDVKNGRTVKGINFLDLKDAGDPVALAKQYAEEGADELVLLDITATLESRKTWAALVARVAAAIRIPFTVGGGISSVEDACALLMAGADKVAVNSAALNRPGLIAELCSRFGSQCVVLAIDAKKEDSGWVVYSRGGTAATTRELGEWAAAGVGLGAGEILFTAMDADGTKGGFAIDALRRLSAAIAVPVIASGGAGTMEHFAEAFTAGNADGALAASVFHFGTITLPVLKQYLKDRGISIRI